MYIRQRVCVPIIASVAGTGFHEQAINVRTNIETAGGCGSTPPVPAPTGIPTHLVRVRLDRAMHDQERHTAMPAESTNQTSAVEAAIEFVATQPAGPEKMLNRHYPRRGGMCAGCVAKPTRYPCQSARIGQLAAKRAQGDRGES